MTKSLRYALTSAGVFWSSAAFAHPGHDEPFTFMSGLSHPFTGWDHMLLISASGVAFALALPSRWLLDMVGWLWLAAMVGIGTSIMSSNEIVFAASVAAVAGGLILHRRRGEASIPFWTIVAISSAFACQLASHLLANGDAPPKIDFATGYALGSVAIFLGVERLARLARKSIVRSSNAGSNT